MTREKLLNQSREADKAIKRLRKLFKHHLSNQEFGNLHLLYVLRDIPYGVMEYYEYHPEDLEVLEQLAEKGLCSTYPPYHITPKGKRLMEKIRYRGASRGIIRRWWRLLREAVCRLHNT